MYTKEQKQIIRELIIYYTAKAEAYNHMSTYTEISKALKKELEGYAERYYDTAYDIIKTLQIIGKSHSDGLCLLNCLDNVHQMPKEM